MRFPIDEWNHALLYYRPLSTIAIDHRIDLQQSNDNGHSHDRDNDDDESHPTDDEIKT